MTSPTGKEQLVHTTAVKALIRKNLFIFSDIHQSFVATPQGFIAGHDRLNKSGIKPKNWSHAPVATMTDDELDSSLYIG